MLSNQDYEVIYLECADCGSEFEFSSEEQEFYESKRFSQPKRCPSCREARRNVRSNRGGGGGGHRKPRYTVICSDCGCETTVPFEPAGDRPVYCSDCYKNK
jgi:CxxC-x17-CxxC domain-containing protein